MANDAPITKQIQVRPKADQLLHFQGEGTPSNRDYGVAGDIFIGIMKHNIMMRAADYDMPSLANKDETQKKQINEMKEMAGELPTNKISNKLYCPARATLIEDEDAGISLVRIEIAPGQSESKMVEYTENEALVAFMKDEEGDGTFDPSENLGNILGQNPSLN